MKGLKNRISGIIPFMERRDLLTWVFLHIMSRLRLDLVRAGLSTTAVASEALKANKVYQTLHPNR